MKIGLLALAVALLAAMAVADECTDGCGQSYQSTVSHANQLFAAKSYIACSGSGGAGCCQETLYGEPLPGNKPCGADRVACQESNSNDYCQAEAQQCCHDNALIFADYEKDRCLSNCGAAPTETPTPQACDLDISETFYGDVGYHRQGAATYYNVSETASAVIVFKQMSGDEVVATPLTINLQPNTVFKLEDCAVEGGMAGCGRELGFSGEGGAILFSSEHSSVRGTINGGGDFIQGATPNGLSFNPIPIPGRYGKVAVIEAKTDASPDFILEVALPTGRIRLETSDGYNEYSVEPYGTMVAQPADGSARLDVMPPEPGAQVMVTSGNVVVSDVATGGSKVLRAGESQSVTVRELAALEPNQTPTPVNSATPGQTPTPGPGPSICGMGFLMLFALACGALVFAARKR